MHMSSYAKMTNFVDKYLDNKRDEELIILDIGSQDVNGTYKDLFYNPLWKYLGCDMVGGNNVDIILSDVYDWKEISTNYADVIVSGQAFEHIEYIWNTMMEMVRVLKEDGIGCIIAPAVCSEHRYPVDCWRIYSDGFRTMAKFAGVKVEEAYTKWQDFCYADGTGVNIIDSVLIFKKVKLSENERIKQQAKIQLVKTLATNYEINIE